MKKASEEKDYSASGISVGTPIFILKEITKFIGWLTGSLAGITAILYACGYLILMYHTQILGLYNVIPYDNVDYIGQGAKFIIYNIISLTDDIEVNIFKQFSAINVDNEIFNHFGAIAVVCACIILLIYILSRRQRWITDSYSSISNWLKNIKECFKNELIVKITFVLIWLVLLSWIPYLSEQFGAPFTSCKNLLSVKCQYDKCLKEKVNNIKGCEDKIKYIEEVDKNIINGAKDKLKKKYDNLLKLCVLTGLLTLIFHIIVSYSKYNNIIVIPFIIYFLFFVLLLPINFGVLRKEIRYSSVELVMNDKNNLLDKSRLFLLGMDSQVLILWDASQCKYIRLQQKDIRLMKISEQKDL